VRTKALCGFLLGVVVMLLLGSASSAARPSAEHFDLSTRVGVTAYLRSLGLRPTGFVVQRAARNYAGPSCPGKRWNCTRSTRVLQIATAAGANVYECTGSPGATDDCTIVQNAPGSRNSAVCTQQDAASAQSCSITQTSRTGKNVASVSQVASLSGSGSSQQVTQTAQVVQSSVSGPNVVTLKQKVTESLTTSASTVAQGQTSAQSYSIQQSGSPFDPTLCPNMTGSNSSSASQSVSQSATAPNAGSGAQSQTANLDGHVDQCSNSNSDSTNTQSETQTETARGPNVVQTQVGPMGVGPDRRPTRGRRLAYSRCCTFQGTNPSDRISVDQSSVQNSSQGSARARLRPLAAGTQSVTGSTNETQLGDCLTSGTCTITHSASQNGSQTTTTSTSTTPNEPFSADLICSNGVCGSGQVAASLAYTGDTAGDYNDPATFSATLRRTDTAPPAPVPGETVTFGLVDPAHPGTTLQSCSATTDASGSAHCSVTLAVVPGAYEIDARFAGSGELLPGSAATPFTVTREEAAVAYTGPALVAAGGTAALSARVTDPEDGLAAAGVGVTFSLGSSTCTATTGATGIASCTVTAPGAAAGATATATVSDPRYEPASASATVIVYEYLARGAFAIADSVATPGTSVTFWGSQWTHANPGTGAPRSFKGFVGSLTPSTTTCVTTPIAYPPAAWSTDPANSPPPPAVLPSYLAVITASSIVSVSSSLIYSTTVPRVVVVRVLTYGGGVGGTGTGTVVGVVCG
jgi:hypothetical protein